MKNQKRTIRSRLLACSLQLKAGSSFQKRKNFFMFKNHLKIAWRNLIKDRQFTFLNVLGLSAGLACALLIYFWVHDEMSVDKFFEKNDQIYQLMERRNASGQIGISDESSGMLGEVLKTQMPQVEYAAALAPPDWFQKFTLTNGDKNIKARGNMPVRTTLIFFHSD